MTSRVAKAPESVGAWGQWCRVRASLHPDSIELTCEDAEAISGRCPCARVVSVVVLRRADYRRLLRAAAGKRGARE